MCVCLVMTHRNIFGDSRVDLFTWEGVSRKRMWYHICNYSFDAASQWSLRFHCNFQLQQEPKVHRAWRWSHVGSRTFTFDLHKTEVKPMKIPNVKTKNKTACKVAYFRDHTFITFSFCFQWPFWNSSILCILKMSSMHTRPQETPACLYEYGFCGSWKCNNIKPGFRV